MDCKEEFERWWKLHNTYLGNSEKYIGREIWNAAWQVALAAAKTHPGIEPAPAIHHEPTP
jgi:hypothetical protein